MDEKDFALRLAQLREKKNVSAREMSLAIGQNAGYINNIESGKSLPSFNHQLGSRIACALSAQTFIAVCIIGDILIG